MVDTLMMAHAVQGRLGFGPWLQDAEDELLESLNDQLDYLQEMVSQMEAGTVTPAQVEDRSGRYGANGGISFNRGLAYVAFIVGTAYEQRFLGNCSPHCQDCVDYAAQGQQPIGTLPRPREKCRCGPNCCCTLAFFTPDGARWGWIGKFAIESKSDAAKKSSSKGGRIGSKGKECGKGWIPSAKTCRVNDPESRRNKAFASTIRKLLSKGGASEIDRILRILDKAETQGTGINTEVIRKAIESFENDSGESRAIRDKYPLALNPKKLESEFELLIGQKSPSLAKLRKLRTQANAGAEATALFNEKLSSALEGVADKINQEIDLRETAAELRREGVLWSKSGDSFTRSFRYSMPSNETQIEGVLKIYKVIPDWQKTEYGRRFVAEKDPLLKDAIIHEIGTKVISPEDGEEEYTYRRGNYINTITGESEPFEDNGIFKAVYKGSTKTSEPVSLEELPDDVRRFFEDESNMSDN
jgi:hypothetical protein